MIRRFKYRSLLLNDKEDSYPLAPRIPIILRGVRDYETLGIIDSGATELSIPLFVADILGLKLNTLIEIKFAEGIGKGYASNVKIIIMMERGQRVELNVPCLILNDSEEIIIGRAGFFENFEVIFREYKKEVVLKYVQKTV